MHRLLGGKNGKRLKDAEKGVATVSPRTDLSPTGPRILVVDSEAHDWRSVFGEGFQVEQGEWEQMMVVSDPKAMVHLRGRSRSASETLLALMYHLDAIAYLRHLMPYCRKGGPPSRSFAPDILLVRKLVRGLTPRDYHTNALYGLMTAGVPSVNSLASIRYCLERPVLYSSLYEISLRLGDRFPLLPITLATNTLHMPAPGAYPSVLKVSSAEAGFGKMRVTSLEAWQGLGAMMASTGDYATLEGFVANREYDIRVQRVAAHLRAYHRHSTNWKGNVGTSVLTEVAVTDEYRGWADACGALFGGIDILTVDAIHTKDGKNYILEMNDTASGFAGTNEVADMKACANLVIERLRSLTPRSP